MSAAKPMIIQDFAAAIAERFITFIAYCVPGWSHFPSTRITNATAIPIEIKRRN